MDGIESSKSSLPVNDNDNSNNSDKSGKRLNIPAKKAKRPRKEQDKGFDKVSSDE